MGMALALAEAGADIIGVSAQLEDDPAASAVGRAVTALGRSFEARRCDLADRPAVLALGAELAERAPDILLNNAGTIRRAPAAEHPLELWDEVLEVNLSAQFALTQLVAAPMLARGSGKVVFTASLLSFQGGINVPGYAASKSGIAGADQGVGQRMGAARGQRQTRSRRATSRPTTPRPSRTTRGRSRSILERIPAGRWGRASDLAGATVFLASAASDYVDGIVLPVDGGWLGR